MSLFLFTLVFVCLCLLTTDCNPVQFTYEPSKVHYSLIDTIDTLAWVTDFAADVSPEPAPNTITEVDEKAIATLDSSNDTHAESASMTACVEARVKEITKANTKADILSNIKRHGWWRSNLSKLSKTELARVQAQRELLAA